MNTCIQPDTIGKISSTGTINSITVVNCGSGYTSTPTILMAGGLSYPSISSSSTMWISYHNYLHCEDY